MKVAIPACLTCGREETVTVSSESDVKALLDTLLDEQASLERLRETAAQGTDTFRQQTLEKLILKTSEKITRTKQILSALE